MTEQTLSGANSFQVRPRIGALCAFIVVPLLLVTLFYYAAADDWFTLSSVIDWMALKQKYGVATDLGFLVIFALFAAFGLPRVYPAVIAGTLLGGSMAVLLALIGATVGSVSSFYVARKLASKRLCHSEWTQELARNGFQLVLFLRLLPGMNSMATTGLAGLTGISVPCFVLATFVGIVPSTVSYVLLGDGLSTGVTWKVGLALATLIMLVACSSVVHIRQARR